MIEEERDFVEEGVCESVRGSDLFCAKAVSGVVEGVREGDVAVGVVRTPCTGSFVIQEACR